MCSRVTECVRMVTIATQCNCSALVAQCGARVPSRTTQQMKQSCDADVHTEHHRHLQMCMEPQWQAFGGSAAGATAGLTRLAEWLGCRDKPRNLPRPEAVCLGRGAPAILAAVEMAGGVLALAAADMAAATCLSRCLMDAVHGPCCKWVTSDVRSRLTSTFAPLGPRMLSAAAAEVHMDVPGSMERACTAVLLTQVLLAADSDASHPNEVLGSRQQQASGVAKRDIEVPARACHCTMQYSDHALSRAVVPHLKPVPC